MCEATRRCTTAPRPSRWSRTAWAAGSCGSTAGGRCSVVRRSCTVLAVAALATACSGPPPAVTRPAASVPSVAPAEPQLLAETLVARGDWAGAVTQYRQALAGRPNDIGLHFGLGSALSHLDRVPEAAAEFVWVVNNAPSTSPEAAAAREWLAQAGKLPSADTQAAAPSTQATRPESGHGVKTGDEEMRGVPYGTVRGITSWPGVTAESNVRLSIGLMGADEATKGKRYPLHIMLGQPYTPSKIPAGAWLRVAKSGEKRLWETRVVVEPSKETVVDLTPDKSSVSPAEFPGR